MAERTRTDFVAGQTLTAAQMDALPAGWLARTAMTSSQGSIVGTEVAISSMETSVTFDAARLVHVAAHLSMESTTDSVDVRIRIKQNGDNVVVRDFLLENLGVAYCLNLDEYIVTTEGTKTFTVTAQRLSGTGTLQVTASSNTPARLFIEDKGAS